MAIKILMIRPSPLCMTPSLLQTNTATQALRMLGPRACLGAIAGAILLQCAAAQPPPMSDPTLFRTITLRSNNALNGTGAKVRPDGPHRAWLRRWATRPLGTGTDPLVRLTVPPAWRQHLLRHHPRAQHHRGALRDSGAAQRHGHGQRPAVAGHHDGYGLRPLARPRRLYPCGRRRERHPEVHHPAQPPHLGERGVDGWGLGRWASMFTRCSSVALPSLAGCWAMAQV
jgi:hypothetical protein